MHGHVPYSGARRGEPVARRRKEPPDRVDVLVSYGLTQRRIDFRVIDLSRARVHVFDLIMGGG